MSALQTNVYVCNFCPSKFITTGLLMQHTHENHKEHILGPKKPIVIKAPPKVDFNKIRKFQEQVKSLGITPRAIRVEADQVLNIKRQPRNYFKDTAKSECLICHKILANHSSLKTHIDGYHLLQKRPCIYCDFETSQKSHLRNHMLLKHNLSKFKCGKCTLSFMHIDDFIKHNKFTHNSKVLISNRNYLDPQEIDTFKCPLCDFKDSYRPEVRQHIVDQHSRKVSLEEAENDIDDPGTTKFFQNLVKYPKRITADNDLNAQNVKIGLKVEMSNREVENDISDRGVGIQTEVDILKEFGIKEENDNKDESETPMTSNEDSEPLQIVTIDPDSFIGISMKSEFPCRY